MTAKRSVRCAIYTRKSTEEGLEQDFNSLDAQREACAAYITSQKAEGWIALPDRYDDGGYSGGTLDRPALKQILRDIEDGKLDVMVVYKIDRLSRSLMDFTRLVEVFDRKSVTFVSVTQSFNTTTSMGRLTLNVLLSFAQFEREVTGERIRDKFAASKKKGIWMGGNPPLGYDVADRKLVVNQPEAETVRLIYQRYLDLGCARLLCADMKERGIVSKLRVFQTCEVRGGKPIERSALYLILNNRTYLGETVHKGASYPGEHDAIVPRSLFDAVQSRLMALAPAVKTTARAEQDAPYAGLLFDETGEPMLPSYTIKRPGLRYRYYVSRPALKGERSGASISRIPAPPFESFLSSVMTRLGLDKVVQVDQVGRSKVVQVVRGSEVIQVDQEPALRRIDVLSNSIVIRFDRKSALDAWRVSGQRERDVIDQHRHLLAGGETLVEDRSELILTLPVRAQFRGGRANVWDPAGPQAAPRPDAALIKALARAHHWRRMLLKGEVTSVEAIAKRYGLDRGHTARTLNLGFLSPALTRAILRGEQSPGVRLTHLLQADLPLSWHEQEAFVAAITDTGSP
jgi:site-specific DNA recombinase